MKSSPRKVVVIAGARGYLGSAMVKGFQKAEYEVVALTADITDASAVRMAFVDIAKKYSAIDACIHAAAPPLVRKPLLDVTDEEFREQIEVAIQGAFFLFREAMKVMLPGGVLIGITTSAIEPGTSIDAVGSYIPAKYALRGMLRVLAPQLATRARVYAIAPGFLPGGLNADMPEKVRELITAKMSQKTTPEEIALLAVELASGTSTIPSGSSVLMPGTVIEPL